jgi:flavodoxin
VSKSLQILIIYATVGGNTELVVDKVRETLISKNSENLENETNNETKKIKFEIKTQRVENTEISQVLEADLTILASPTYGQGTVESHFLPFLKNLEKANLTNKNFAVIGLGSPKFYPEYLTESATILENSIKKASGNLIIPSMRIGGEVLKILDKIVPNWTNKLITKLSEIH